MTTSTDIVNEALMLIGGDQQLVTGVAPNFDNSTSGKAAKQLYGLSVQAVARQYSWDFGRNTIALTPTGNTPRLFAYEYNYPPNGIEVWELAPAVDPDPFDPLPVNYSVANAVVGGVQKKVIQTDLASAWAIYNNNPTEDTWDPLFRQSVVRLLASALAMGIAGKPDLAQLMLESGSAFETLGETRRD